MSYLINVTLKDDNLPPLTAEIKQERRTAIFDLLEENYFILCNKNAPPGPYILNLSIIARRLVFDVKTKDNLPCIQFHLSLSPIRQVIKDYFAICESYFKAVIKMPLAQIESIDMGRRSIHNEGAEQLQERLNGKIAIDQPTARRLFTLICVLYFKS